MTQRLCRWADPACWHMTCRSCVSRHMMRCDLSVSMATAAQCAEAKAKGNPDANSDVAKQRCNDCFAAYGGFHVHDNATRKIMLMQACGLVIMRRALKSLDHAAAGRPLFGGE